MTGQNEFWPFRKKAYRTEELPPVQNLGQEPNSHNHYIEDYLDYYCNLPNAPNFAVLLKGKWGAGKTFFIQNYRRKLEKFQKKKSIYINLYGASRLSDIDDKFLQELYPIRSSQAAGVAWKVLKGLLKGSLKIDLDQDGREDGSWSFQIPEISLPKHLEDVNQRILVFDDLERCNIKLEDLFGYINYFVENESGTKVIVVANEEEVIVKDKNYNQIKEKLIGKTFNIEFDLNSALRSFVEALSSEAAKKFLLGKIDIVQEIYQKANHENLRSLKQISLDFERIFEALPEEAKGKVDLTVELLKVLVALSIDIKCGNINTQDIRKLSESYAETAAYKRAAAKAAEAYKRGITVEEASQGEIKAKEFEENECVKSFFSRYSMVSFGMLFPDETWWIKFFDCGVLDKEGLTEAVQASTYFRNENMASWKRLWHFTDLSDEEFVEILSKVELENADRNYQDPMVIKHVFGTLLKLSKIGLYSKSSAQILEDSKIYIEQLIEQFDYSLSTELLLERMAVPISSSFGLTFDGREYDEFKEFELHIQQSVEIAKKKRLPLVAKELLDSMKADQWKFHKILCADSSFQKDVKSYHDVPFLMYVDENAFIENLLSMKNQDRQLAFHSLAERYKYSRRGLPEELDWLLSMQSLLVAEADNRQGKVTGHCLSFLNSHYLCGLIENLQRSNDG